jgi:hypothetical protein
VRQPAIFALPRNRKQHPTTIIYPRVIISHANRGSGSDNDSCPDIWELSNGDIAVIGRDLTEAYRGRLPNGVTVDSDERLIVLPRSTMIAAKVDIPDA